MTTRALASAAAVAGMVSLPAGALALDAYGPTSRFVIAQYLPAEGTFIVLVGGSLGAWLGAEAVRLLRGRGPSFSAVRVAAGCGVGTALGLVAGIAVGSLLERLGVRLSGPVFFASVAAAAALSGGLGAALAFRPRDEHGGPRRFSRALLVPLTLFVIPLAYEQLDAFPASAPLGRRQAWASRKVHGYDGLVGVVARTPEVVASVGRPLRIGPARGVEQRVAYGMDGTEVRLTLDVEGERGAGVYFADCAIDQGVVLQWGSPTWTFDGRTVPLPAPPQGAVTGGNLAR